MLMSMKHVFTSGSTSETESTEAPFFPSAFRRYASFHHDGYESGYRFNLVAPPKWHSASSDGHFHASSCSTYVVIPTVGKVVPKGTVPALKGRAKIYTPLDDYFCRRRTM